MTTTFLTSGDLIGMQNVLNRSLPGTAVIQRNTNGPDGQGGQTDTWAAVGTTVCRVSPYHRVMGAEAPVGGRVLAERERLVTFPANTDIIELDRVVTNGVTYEVVGMAGPRSFELDRRVHCVKV